MMPQQSLPFSSTKILIKTCSLFNCLFNNQPYSTINPSCIKIRSQTKTIALKIASLNLTTEQTTFINNSAVATSDYSQETQLCLRVLLRSLRCFPLAICLTPA